MAADPPPEVIVASPALLRDAFDFTDEEDDALALNPKTFAAAASATTGSAFDTEKELAKAA
jgi:hypothetical protein